MEADSVVTLLTITSTAFVTSTLTALIGAGGGTALLLVMLWFVPAASVVPVHGCIQLVSNTARVVLFRRHMHWPVIIRFVIPMPAGVYVGLQLYGMLDQSALQLVIAGFVLLSLLVRVPGAVAGRAFPAWAYLPAGFLIGGANMLVGVLAPILAPFCASSGWTRNEPSARLASSALPAMSSRPPALYWSDFPSPTICP